MPRLAGPPKEMDRLAADTTDRTERLVKAITSASYPDVDTATAVLDPTQISQFHRALVHAKLGIEGEVRSLSKQVAPDVDGWIARANQVQQDIERSKAIAREIVAQADSFSQLQAQAGNAVHKVNLLEEELGFNTSLQAVLKQIQECSFQLAATKQLVLKHEVEKAYQTLSVAQHAIASLDGAGAGNASRILTARAALVKESVVQSCAAHIHSCLRFDTDRKIYDHSEKTRRLGDSDLETCVSVLRELRALDPIARSIGHSLHRCFLEVWEDRKTAVSIPRLNADVNTVSFDHTAQANSATLLLEDVGTFLDHVVETIPRDLSQLVMELIVPPFFKDLQKSRLNDSVPISLDKLHDFDEVLGSATKLSARMKAQNMPGHEQLGQWVENAPRVWLARQREHALESVRRSLLANLQRTMIVERLETQVVDAASKDEGQNGWDMEWKDEDGRNPQSSPTKPQDGTTRARDNGESYEPGMINGSDQRTSAADEEEAAWGWGQVKDENPASTTAEASRSSSNGGSTPTNNMVTLKEVYTVTRVPEDLLAECARVVEQSHRLSGSQYAKSAIAPGIAGLSSIPTLVTALYRATAFTAYDKIDHGRVLLYNDCMRLSDLLTAFAQKDEYGKRMSASAHRKMQQDIFTFQRFARTAYSSEMDSQKTILRDMLEGAQGFANCTTSPYEKECDMAVSMAIERLRDVHRHWSNILARSALMQATGSLLATVTSKFMLDVQELSDIGEEESRKLLSYVRSISSISDIFTERHAELDEVRDMTLLYCPNWLRFQYLGEILDGSLADIKYLWSESELSMEYDAEEVVDLIEALFADSEHRRAAIAEVRSSRK